jgi:hypothetical protein
LRKRQNWLHIIQKVTVEFAKLEDQFTSKDLDALKPPRLKKYVLEEMHLMI